MLYGGKLCIPDVIICAGNKRKNNFFVDSNQNKVGRKIAGKEIKSIDANPDDGTLVIVCSMNYSKEMAEKCEQQGIRYYIY